MRETGQAGIVRTVITRKDVARRAGVSVATVSAVMNKNRYVSLDLITRVEEAVRALGYHPNAIARSLTARQTRTLAVIIPNILSPFWSVAVKAIQDVATTAGYRILLHNTNESADEERASLEMLEERRVDGAILVPVGEANKVYALDLLQRGLSIVLLDRRIANIPADTVVSNNQFSAYQATQHLLQTGRRRVGFVSLPFSVSCCAERLRGYEQALAEVGIVARPSLVKVGQSSEESGYECVNQLLADEPEVDAIVATTHGLTVGALKALIERRKRIPEDVALIGYDDFPWVPYLNVPLTVVAQPQASMGRTAAGLLLRRLSAAQPSPPQEIVLDARLVHRQSCGCGGN